MAKYSYDPAVLQGLGVGAFLGEVKLREAHIAAAPETDPAADYNANRLAAALHPSVQYAVVSSVTEHPGAKSYVLIPDRERGTKRLAYFRAGQYVSVSLQFDGAALSRPYTIRSNPADALDPENSSYTLTVKENADGNGSAYILKTWSKGTRVVLSQPLGDFCYQGLRDAGQVLALAGGSGITPFYSMAAAIASGLEDFDLTILYGSRDKDSILLADELLAVALRSHGRVKVIHILSEEEAPGFEHGFIDAAMIRKYAPAGDYSVFICGPKAMYRFLEAETPKLGLPKRRIRFELSGAFGDPARDPAYPPDAQGKTFTLKVIIRGEETSVQAPSSATLLDSMEAAGIRVPSDCRSGQCGWCHSRLISGEVFIPESHDGRRLADKKFGWIHPCSTYPLSDIALEVFPPA